MPFSFCVHPDTPWLIAREIYLDNTSSIHKLHTRMTDAFCHHHSDGPSILEEPESMPAQLPHVPGVLMVHKETPCLTVWAHIYMTSKKQDDGAILRRTGYIMVLLKSSYRIHMLPAYSHLHIGLFSTFCHLGEARACHRSVGSYSLPRVSYAPLQWAPNLDPDINPVCTILEAGAHRTDPTRIKKT